MFDCDLNKRVVDSLIRSGSFDSMGYRRSQLLAVYEQVLDSIARDRRRNLEGQFDLFGGGGDSASVPTMVLPDLEEFAPRELMRMEKETTGLYLTGHPMDEYRAQARKCRAVPLASILSDFKSEEGPQQYRDGQRVTVAGIIAAVKTKTTKNNTLMAYVSLEDDTGTMELLCFSRVLGDSGAYLKAGVPVAVQGKISVRDEKEPQLMADQVVPLGEPGGGAAGEELWIKLERSDAAFPWLRRLLDMFPGEDQTIVYLADRRKKLQTQCRHHPALLQELAEVLGQENVVQKEKAR